MQHINKSWYSSYFEQVADRDIFVLDEGESKIVWSRIAIGAGRGFYDSQLAEWLHLAGWQTVGRWLEPFNNGNAAAIANLLKIQSGWACDTSLLFIKDSKNILTFNFADFCDSPEVFLSVFDDGPLMCEKELGAGAAFIFAPLGHVFFKPKTVTQRSAGQPLLVENERQPKNCR